MCSPLTANEAVLRLSAVTDVRPNLIPSSYVQVRWQQPPRLIVVYAVGGKLVFQLLQPGFHLRVGTSELESKVFVLDVIEDVVKVNHQLRVPHS